MKNFIIMCLVALSTTIFAQDINLSVQGTTGGNYAVVGDEALTGVTSLAQLNIVNVLDEDLGLELGLAAGYSSLASTFKTTVAQVSLGFTDNNFISGGFIVQYMDKDDMLSGGLYGQLNYPLTKDDEGNSKLFIPVRVNFIANVLEFQNLPSSLSASIGVGYKF